MIKIKLNEYILQKHLDYCMGNETEASVNRNSLYKKLNDSIKNCTNKDLRNILIFLSNNFKNLVIGNPFELNKIKENISDKIKTAVLKEQLPEKQDKKEKEIKEALEAIFSVEYERFTDRNVKNPKLWWAYTFVQSINISVCPYCNSQFIFTYFNEEGRTRPVLDHFFCKSEYPFLSISIYNLIPCCKVCNSDFKGSTQVDLKNYLNPYIHEFEGKIHFKRELIPSKSTKQNYFSAITGESNNFKITLDYGGLSEELVTPYKQHAKLFHLEEIYQYHKNYVKDFIIKYRIYNDVYTNQLKSSYNKLFKNDDNLNQILMPKKEEMHNIILSKLTRDIVRLELNKK
ncbi:hypothetical protein COM08_15445 [Bacillus wiedmannii]|uniref:hypothetical protein n=1 Tax=Bacillus TaxID=1386 RepID=UPI000BF8B041|nr:hypothetical protein [Bacillus wiedmannii]PGC17895.1 hypothetical protein COM08_15445 [Bacillus wiedmannii]